MLVASTASVRTLAKNLIKKLLNNVYFLTILCMLGRALRPRLSMQRKEKLMKNRVRNERLEIRLTEKERDLFEEKMRKVKCKTMSHFIRRCVLEKEINVVDLDPFRDLQWEISKVGNNINQIAKAVNTNAVIYKNDIKKDARRFG